MVFHQNIYVLMAVSSYVTLCKAFDRGRPALFQQNKFNDILTSATAAIKACLSSVSKVLLIYLAYEQ